MSTTVHEIRAPVTLALFYSMDDDPKFGVLFCAAERLQATVQSVMFPGPDDLTPPNAKEECERLAAELRQSGSVSFEDGWLELRTGLQDAVAFMMEKVKDARADERYADQQRADEHRRLQDVATKYAALCVSLQAALGEHVRGIVDLSKAGAGR